jgi:hypothetical protein
VTSVLTLHCFAEVRSVSKNRLCCAKATSIVLFVVVGGLPAYGELLAESILPEAEERIIHYDSAEALTDPVALMQHRLDAGNTRLRFQSERGYLPDLLKALGVSPTSQCLVFSKTSSQADYTSPATPRAIYFSDNVSIAWVPGAPEIDLASIDPDRGPVFYTLDQNTRKRPAFVRRQECMQCHFGIKTFNVPAGLVRSVYTATDGTPVSRVDGFMSGHTDPLELRWGGWYVTGQLLQQTDLRSCSLLSETGRHGSTPRVSTESDRVQPHLGNLFSTNKADPEQLDGTPGTILYDLRGRFDTSRYPSHYSDVVALLVLEHEVRMQNLITYANYQTRYALAEMTSGGQHASARAGLAGWPEQRVALAGEMLLQYLLFRDEAALKGPIHGTSGFTAQFERAGPRASGGRSLRQFDLKTRLMRYPCSFLIYSPSFDALPQEMRRYLWKRLVEILTGEDRSPTYSTMPAEDRHDVLEILRETKPEFALWLRNAPTVR